MAKKLEPVRRLSSWKCRLAFFILGIFCLLPAWALRIPDSDLKEMQLATQTIESFIQTMHQSVSILLLVLVLSIASNIFMVLAFLKAQEQVKLALESMKNLDVTKEIINKALISKLNLEQVLPGEIEKENPAEIGYKEEDSIEILHRESKSG